MDIHSPLKQCVAALVAISLIPPSSASDYQALCDDHECRITIDARGVTTSRGFIPSAGVVQWYTGGEGEHYKTAEGVAGGVAGAAGGAAVGAIATCWTIILCPIGFFGGMAAGAAGGARAGRRSDYTFTVIGYTEGGDKISGTFRFVNSKPVRQVMNELPVMTGLAMGQLRPLDTVTEALGFKSTAEQKKMLKASDMPLKLGEVARQEKKPANCWSNYLDSNPAMKEWAEANPAQAEQNKKRYNDC